MSEQEKINQLEEKLGTLKDIEFAYVAKGGSVKMIAWGEDYQSWTPEKRLEFAEALASAMNEGLELMQNERNIALEEAVRLQEQLAEVNKSLETIRNTNVTAITNFNSEKQEMARRIKELETQLSDAEKRAAVAEAMN